MKSMQKLIRFMFKCTHCCQSGETIERGGVKKKVSPLVSSNKFFCGQKDAGCNTTIDGKNARIQRKKKLFVFKIVFLLFEPSVSALFSLCADRKMMGRERESIVRLLNNQRGSFFPLHVTHCTAAQGTKIHDRARWRWGIPVSITVGTDYPGGGFQDGYFEIRRCLSVEKKERENISWKRERERPRQTHEAFIRGSVHEMKLDFSRSLESVIWWLAGIPNIGLGKMDSRCSLEQQFCCEKSGRDRWRCRLDRPPRYWTRLSSLHASFESKGVWTAACVPRTPFLPTHTHLRSIYEGIITFLVTRRRRKPQSPFSSHTQAS